MNTQIYREKNKKITGIYLGFLVISCILIIGLFMNSFYEINKNRFLGQTFKEIETESFIQAIYQTNRSVAYICHSHQREEASILNKSGFMRAINFPMLDYFMQEDNKEYSYDFKEVYPLINAQLQMENQKDIYIDHNLYNPEDGTIIEKVVEAGASQGPIYSIEDLSNINFLTSKIYTVDRSIRVKESDFDIDYFAHADMSLTNQSSGPKILIYHTHANEAFVDSASGNVGDTVIGMGDTLAKLLVDKYGIEVYHLRNVYDVIDGKLDRSGAYKYILPDLKKILKENPSIEIMIDLHRDGVGENVKLDTVIDGKSTAKIMFFNGLAKTLREGKMVDSEQSTNPYLKDNMAFSFQMHMKALELYPGLVRKIYLRGYRYNLHLLPKSLLIEVGAQTNTVEEAKNAMEPLAKILYEVINPK